MLLAVIRAFVASVLRIIWPAYMKGGNRHDPLLVLKHYVAQKIFRINSHVPWPVHSSTTVTCPDKIIRGDRTPGLSKGCHIDGRNGIIVGENVWIGPRVTIVSMNHDMMDYHKYISNRPVVIKKNCWLGANAVILPGVEIGEHTVVAAGTVVTKSFAEKNQVIAGNPARVVKRIGEYGGAAN